MAFDGNIIKSLIINLKESILGGRIDKVFQPEKDEIILSIRSNRRNLKLLISANNNYPRVHLTSNNKQNPLKAPDFCMLLRKHIQNGKIKDILQFSNDRIIEILIESKDELNILEEKSILIEIMGKHSNIILVKNNKVIDSIKRVGIDMSKDRQIMPGVNYELPPTTTKYNPYEIESFKKFFNIINLKTHKNLFKAIQESFYGLSPIFIREIIHSSNLSEEIKVETLKEEDIYEVYINIDKFKNLILKNNLSPTIFFEKSIPKYFYLSKLNHLSIMDSKSFDNINELLDYFYLEKANKQILYQKSNDLRKNINNQINKLKNKILKINKELDKARNYKKNQLLGDLITSNIHLIKKGESKVSLINYYDPDSKNIEVDLNKNLTPSQNAQKYYKKYNKDKKAIYELEKQLNLTQNLIDYLDTIIFNIENAQSLDDIDLIKIELEENNIIKTKKTNKKIKKPKATQPLKYTSSEGLKILVGRNNKQNDELTFKISNKEDLWFHIKDQAGSHVILEANNHEFTEISVLESAILAGYHSKSKYQTKVEIDYTKRKYVKKIPGAKPGMVTYSNFSTIIVDATEENYQKIKKE